MEKDISVKFAEYIAENRFNKFTQKSYCGKTVMWFSSKKSIGVTTEELFNQFKKLNQNEPK